MELLGNLTCISLACLIAWYRVIHCDKVVDDRHDKIEHGALKKAFIDLKASRNTLKFVKDLQDALGNFGTFKNVKKDHKVSLIIHIIVSNLIYVAFGSNFISFISALLFAVNPCTNQVSAWCNGKRYGVNTIYVLLSYMWMPAVFFLYPLGLVSQINLLPLPLLLAFKGYWLPLALCPLLAIPSYMFLRRWYKSRVKKVPKNSDFVVIAPRKLILMVKTYNYYFWHGLMPRRCTIFTAYNHYFSIGKGFTEEVYSFNKDLYISLITAVGVLITIILTWGSLISIGLIWFSLFIAQWLGLLMVSMPIADRYLYLPLVGLMVFFGSVLHTGFGVLALPVILAIYILKSWETCEQYKDMESMIKYHLYYEPQSPICYMSIINNLIIDKNFNGAYYWADMMVKAFPEDGYAHYLFGNACASFDQIGKAEYHLNMALVKMDKHKLERFEDNIKQGLQFLKFERERREQIENAKTNNINNNS